MTRDLMVKTQIQLPGDLYRQVKRLAQAKEWSMAEVCRRGLEYMLAAHPKIEEAPQEWKPPKPVKVGINKKIPVSNWRRLANESPIEEKLPGEKKPKK